MSGQRRRGAVAIGGSMSDLLAAAFLRKIGWNVKVHERSSIELVGRGAGMTKHCELIDALAAPNSGGVKHLTFLLAGESPETDE